MIRKELDYWVDEKSNKWSIYIYSYDEAFDYSVGLIRCYNCIDCIKCIDCIGCNKCEECNYCEYCNHCIGSERCISISRGKSCSLCFNSKIIDNCRNCTDCYDCKHLVNCDDCVRCFNKYAKNRLCSNSRIKYELIIIKDRLMCVQKRLKEALLLIISKVKWRKDY